jgi:hypothetical protein
MIKKIPMKIPLIIILGHMMMLFSSMSNADINNCGGLPMGICDPIKANIINQATVIKKSKYHVKFTEYIDDNVQKHWKQGYEAKIELFINGSKKESLTFRGSTLPNNFSTKNPKKEYSVLMSTCHFDRFYTWKRGLRADRKRPTLRLQHTTPTVNVSSVRDIVPTYLSRHGHFNFAENILVHSGYKTSWRGSAGCLTLHPDDSKDFFNKIPMGVKGTLEVSRQVGTRTITSCY